MARRGPAAAVLCWTVVTPRVPQRPAGKESPLPRTARTAGTARTAASTARRRLGGACALAAALTALVCAPAPAAPAPAVGAPVAGATATAEPPGRPKARIVAHFDFAAGQTPENIALEPDGSANLTFAFARQVVRVTERGDIRVLATLPAVANPDTPLVRAAVVSGIARAHDGTLYVNYLTGTADRTGVWRITPDGAATRIAALPPTSFANGLALDEHRGVLYAADSVLATVWRISLDDGSVTAWAEGDALRPTTFIGANGIKVHRGAVWVSNADRGTLLRIPVRADGTAGPIGLRAEGLPGIEDFAFPGRGDTLLAALSNRNELVLLRPDGTRRTVLTAKDGLSGPTSVAVRRSHGTVYVPSAAFDTGIDPNLLIAGLPARRPPRPAHS
ncbi:hypothetical protein [Streptomyces sp. NPDC002054]|uniref:hypothetical protein n=1 Tax=Streptomyces sp. NPDC002054 TaxID=3154663 RepID=UPI003328FEC8